MQGRAGRDKKVEVVMMKKRKKNGVEADLTRRRERNGNRGKKGVTSRRKIVVLLWSIFMSKTIYYISK